VPPNVQFANCVLAGFERVHLEAGASKLVVLHVPLRPMQYWSMERHAWVTPDGSRTVWVGGSSRDRRIEASIGRTSR
jgi:beta-glucosidase